MRIIKQFFAKVAAWFGSGRAETDFNKALALVPKVAPVVEQIAILTPNRSVQELAAAYEHYGVPISADLLEAPGLEKGYLLLNLATTVLAVLVPGVPTRLIQLAIQAVYAAIKAK